MFSSSRRLCPRDLRRKRMAAGDSFATAAHSWTGGEISTLRSVLLAACSVGSKSRADPGAVPSHCSSVDTDVTGALAGDVEEWKKSLMFASASRRLNPARLSAGHTPNESAAALSLDARVDLRGERRPSVFRTLSASVASWSALCWVLATTPDICCVSAPSLHETVRKESPLSSICTMGLSEITGRSVAACDSHDNCSVVFSRSKTADESHVAIPRSP